MEALTDSRLAGYFQPETPMLLEKTIYWTYCQNAISIFIIAKNGASGNRLPLLHFPVRCPKLAARHSLLDRHPMPPHAPVHDSSPPPAGISVDLDNLWAYLKTRGDARWRGYPSCFAEALPIVREFFRERRIAATFFIVGKDAENERDRQALAELADDGHEIANHGYSHEVCLNPPHSAGLSDSPSLESEIERGEDAIARISGAAPRGYRGAGFGCSPAQIEILGRRGYAYDSSLWPTWCGSLARAAYFRMAKVGREARLERASLWSGAQSSGWPNRPFLWAMKGGAAGLAELPVSVFAGLRLPAHVSYWMALAERSMPLARLGATLSIRAARWAGGPFCALLHPTDFLDSAIAPPLAFFPGMQVPAAAKIRFLHAYFDRIERQFRPVPLRDLARWAADRPATPVLDPGLLGRM